jgi:hypothetical protein
MTWGEGKGCCVQLSSDCVALAFRIQVLCTPLDNLPFQRDPVFSYNLSELWLLYSGKFFLLGAPLLSLDPTNARYATWAI